MKYALPLCLSLAACGPTPQTAATPAGPASDPRPDGRATTELENLAAFADLYGYIRFFHPTDAAAEADWQALAASGVASVRDAETLGELASRLDAFYTPLAPTMQLWTIDEAIPAPAEPPPPRAASIYWQYQGFPGTPVSVFRPPYRQARIGTEGVYRTFAERPSPDTRVDDELVPDLRARIPVVLSPQVASHGDAVPRDLEPDDSDVRLAAVIEVWNVLRHFYPYPEAIEGDWDAILQDALTDAQDDESREDTVATLNRLVHRIRDGHGEAGHSRGGRRAALPFRIELVDQHAVITGTSQPDRFAVGDIVDALDGEPVVEAVARIEREVSGSPQWRRFKAATWIVPSGPAGETVEVALRRGKKAWTASAAFTRDTPPASRRPEPIHRFDDGTFYVDLTRAAWSSIEERLEEIAIAPGVVFDMRGYPNDTHRVLEHLLTEPEDADWMHVPRYVEPGGRPIGFHHIGWHLRPQEPRIEGAVAFLTSAEAISYAESVLAYVEAHDLGTVIGSTPTAGTNGDIVRFDTVGGWYVIFTGMRVTHHDGRPFHLRGITPDLVVTPTVDGLRRGRDEQLLAALGVVR